MALIGNRTLQGLIVATQFGSATAPYHFAEAVSPYAKRNARFVGGVDKQAGTPWGHSHPYAWVLPLSDGGINAKGSASGSGSAFGYAARPMVMSGAGVGNGSAVASAVSSGVATGAGTGNGTAEAQAVVTSAATGAGTGNGTAFMGGIINVIVQGSAAGSGVATMIATANIVATGGGIPDATLTPQQIASAVWDAAASSYDSSGTMGEKLNNTEKNSKLIPAGI